MIFKRNILLYVLMAIANTSSAASYTCNDNLSKPELMICSDNNLSLLDCQIDVAYRIAAKAKIKMSVSQREWLRTRDKCLDIGCMRTAYEERIDILEKQIADYTNNLKQDEVDLEGWPSGSAMATGSWYLEKTNRMTLVLEGAHEVLLSLIPSLETFEYKGKKGISSNERLIEAIRSHHAEWSNFMKKECELVGSSTGAGGTWPSTYAIECELKATEKMYQKLRSAIACVIELREANKLFEYGRCTRELTYLEPSE